MINISVCKYQRENVQIIDKYPYCPMMQSLSISGIFICWYRIPNRFYSTM